MKRATRDILEFPKTLLLPEIIDHIYQGESDHFWDHVLRKSRSKFNIRNGLSLVWNLFSFYIAYESNLIYNTLGNDGADQIPNVIPSLNFWLAGPAAYGVNFVLSLYLTVLFEHEYEKCFQLYKLAKKQNVSISYGKMMAKEIGTLIFAGFAAVPFWMISKKLKSLRTEIFTFGEYTIQSYFGSEPLLRTMTWKITNCKKGILDQAYEDDDEESVKTTIQKLNELNNTLLSNNLPLIDISENPQPAEIKQYIADHLATSFGGKAGAFIPNIRSCPSYLIHFVMQLTLIASNVGYAYDTAYNLEIENPLFKIPVASAGITAFVVLGMLFVYRTTETFLEIGRNSLKNCQSKLRNRREKSDVKQSPMSSLDSRGKPLLEESHSDLEKGFVIPANQNTSLLSYQNVLTGVMWATLIASYFLAYYSSSSCLKLNKDTNWDWASSFPTRLLACIGTTLFNGYSVMKMVNQMKAERNLNNLPNNKRAILITLDKLIEYLEYVNKNKNSEPIQIKIR